jgi:hypothetical protein
MPAPVPTLATLALLLVHVPPPVVEDRVVVDPAHNEVVPVIVAGIALTVIEVVLAHPATI